MTSGSFLCIDILPQTLENEEQYTEEELKEYERMLMEEEERRRQQGAFNSHAQPGLVVSKNHNSLCNFKILISAVSFSLTHRKNSVVSCHDCKKCLLVCLFYF